MQQEQQVIDGAPVHVTPADVGTRPSAGLGAGPSGGAPLRVVPDGMPAGPLAETVPSDQLWRAAIRAAREAAAIAADLRRQLADGADSGPRAVA